MPQIKATTSQQIQKFLDENGGVAVIDFYAVWCGPCRAISPYIQNLAAQTGIPLIKVDVDQASDLSQSYSVQSMPTIIVISNHWNNIAQKVVGASQPHVYSAFQKARQLRQ